MLAALHCLSSYSLLASPNKLEDLVVDAKAKGYQAIALTDINYLYGLAKFDKVCQEEGIKPIFGMTLRYDKYGDKKDLVLLAKNEHGYHDLLKLSSKIAREEHISLNDCLSYLQQLVIIHPVENGELYSYLKEEEFEKAREFCMLLENLDCYFEISTYSLDFLNKRISMFSDMIGIPLIASNQVKYLEADDAFYEQVLIAIKDEKTINDINQTQTNNYLLASSKWNTFFRENHFLQEAWSNMQKVAKLCNVKIKYHQDLLPKFQVPNNDLSINYLEKQCRLGVIRVPNWNNQYEERLKKELTIIETMGFADYFLIIWDVMSAARKLNILTAPGRGSAAGSLVAYLLQITDVDPLKYGLLFERFLNPERQTMPDIDLDFPDLKRDQLYKYMQEKYGVDYTARIITFGTLAAKQVIRDVSRVFGLSRIEQDEFANATYVKAHDTKITLKQAYHDSYKLRQIVNRNERNQRVYQTALKLEGLPRNTGMHAAGLVLSNCSLTNIIPTQFADMQITQWTMTDVERLGLLKMDFLSLRNLTIIEDTITSIKNETGQELNIKNIPLDDPKVYAAFSRGETTGIFQFESLGMRNLLKKIKVQNIEDLALVNALHRPGASLNPDELIARRFKLRKVVYPDPCLKKILAETYGIMVYQEQVMQVAVEFAGFTLAEADNLRRAMSKKNTQAMKKEKEPFINKAIAKGHSLQQSEKIFEQIAAFAGYGFNKSHAIAYSMLAYQMMYLKINYPLNFYMALFRSVSPKSKTFMEYLQSMKEQNLTLKGPDINQSDINFRINNKKIIMGFNAIKGLDKTFINSLLAERENGKFTSFFDLLKRLPVEIRKEKYIEALIQAGALDSFNSNRSELLENLTGILQNIELGFDDSDYLYHKVTKESFMKRIQAEKNRLGLYVSAYPVDKYKNLANNLQLKKLPFNLQDGEEVRTLIWVTKTYNRYTKSHQRMQKIMIDQYGTTISGTVFFDTLVKYGEIQPETIYLVEGKIKVDRYGTQIVINYYQKAKILQEKLEGEKIYLLVPDDYYVKKQIQKRLKIDYLRKDAKPVILVFEKDKQRYLLNEHYWIDNKNENFEQIRRLLGENRIAFK